MRRGWLAYGLSAWIVACGPTVEIDGDTGGGADSGAPQTGGSGARSGATATPGDGAPGEAESMPGEDGPAIDSFDDDGGTFGEGPVGSTGTTEGGTTWGEGGEGGPLEPGFDTDAGEPGGVGPGAILDPIDDVTLGGADAIASAVYTDGVMVDFRAQFDDRPFPASYTYDITWCLDIAGLDGDASCMTHSSNIDEHFGVVSLPPFDGEAYGGASLGVDPCEHGSYEPETRTLRLLVPIELAGGSDDFDWTLLVNFGGSGGDAEFVPDVVSAPVEHVAAFPPFAGIPSCY